MVWQWQSAHTMMPRLCLDRCLLVELNCELSCELLQNLPRHTVCLGTSLLPDDNVDVASYNLLPMPTKAMKVLVLDMLQFEI